VRLFFTSLSGADFGLSSKLSFFTRHRSLHEETGIDLENICYYKDDTHYFVMTAKKTSLLARKVLKQDHQDTNALLSPDNVDRERLLQYARDAAVWSTGLQKLQFALNHYGEADVAMFDFTSMYAAENACRAKPVYQTDSSTRGHRCRGCECARPDSNGRSIGPNVASEPNGLLLTALVGDSLLEPFWPTGSGAGRGFLSALDAAWMCRQWTLNRCWSQPQDEAAILKVLSERESVYRLLAQTTPENLSQNYSACSLNPASRYPNLNSLAILPTQVRHLLYEGEKRPAARRTLCEKRQRRATIACPISVRDSEPERAVRPSTIRDAKPMPNAFEEETTNGSSSSSSSSGSSQCESSAGHAAVTLTSVHEARSKQRLQDELQQSLTSLQQSYEQLLEHERQLLLDSDGTPTHKTAPMLHEWLETGVSPSACKMASLERTRCKELDAVVRQRKLRQQVQAQEHRELTANRLSLDEHTKQHAEQLLRNKAAWLLSGQTVEFARHQQQLDSFGNSYRDFSRRFYGAQDDLPPQFANRVQQLERKLCGLDDSLDLRGKFDDDRPRGSCGVNVMMARTHLQQLLDPIKQEERFRAEVKRKTFMEKEYKFVGKLTKEDWNVKCFEHVEDKGALKLTFLYLSFFCLLIVLGFLIADLPKEDVSDCNPRPKERVAIFKEKLNHMQNMLSGNSSELESLSDKNRLKPEEMRSSKEKCGQWIEKLKNDLNGKQNGKTIEPTAKDRRVFANVRAAFGSDDTNEPEVKAAAIKAKGVSSRTSVKTPEVKLNGKMRFDDADQTRHVFNRQQNCRLSKPKVAMASEPKLTKSEPRTMDRGRPNLNGSSLSHCCRCDDKVLTVDKIIVGGKHFHRSCLTCAKCGVTLRLSEVRNAMNTCGPNEAQLCSYECILCARNRSNAPVKGKGKGKEVLDKYSTVSSASCFAQTFSSQDLKQEDEYERKLKERMKWKEMFLLNSEAVPSVGPADAEQAKGSVSPLKERIEFENSSISFELFDEDKLTRMLNLDERDEAWANGNEEDDEEEEYGPAFGRRSRDAEEEPGRDKDVDEEEEEEEEDEEDEDEDDEDEGATSTTFDESTDDDFNSDQFDLSEEVKGQSSTTDSELPMIVVSDEHTPPADDCPDSESLTLNELPDLVAIANQIDDTMVGEGECKEKWLANDQSRTNSKSDSHRNSRSVDLVSSKSQDSRRTSTSHSKQSDSSEEDTFSDLNLVSAVDDTNGPLISVRCPDSPTCTVRSADESSQRLIDEAEPIDKEDVAESTFSFRVETPKLFCTETYSKIPVLAARVDALSTRPVYCGSFTEKLLKCRSSPTLNQQFAKWSGSSPDAAANKECDVNSKSATTKSPHSLVYPHFWNLSSSALLEGRKGNESEQFNCKSEQMY
jgi:hypothetical protein